MSEPKLQFDKIANLVEEALAKKEIATLEIKNLGKDLNKLSEQRFNTVRKLSVVKREKRDLEIQLTKLASSITKDEDSVVLAEANLLEVRTKLDCSQFVSLFENRKIEDIDDLKSQLTAIQIKLALLTNNLETSELKMANINKKITDLNNEISKLREIVESTETDISKVKSQIREANRQIDERIMRNESVIDIVYGIPDKIWMRVQITIIETKNKDYHTHIVTYVRKAAMGQVKWWRLREGFRTGDKEITGRNFQKLEKMLNKRTTR